MKVIYSPDARHDLDNIRRWIGKDDRTRSVSFVRELVAQADGLARWPNRFPEVDADRHPGLRRLNYRRYRILYVVRNGRVEVLAFHHGSRGDPDFR